MFILMQWHYNAELDQVMFSAKHLHEIYIVDHSTTTLEAEGHTGGTSNHGGDFLWRWGNPQVYQQGTAADQTLFDQHNCTWIPSAYSDSGKISLFNNNGDGTGSFSSLNIIAPEFVGNAYTMDPNKFLPLAADWSWNGSILGDVVHETKRCGMQVLSSGNILFCESSIGRINEITRAGDHLWSYRNPTEFGGAIYTQYDVITNADMTIFRGEHYDPSYPGLSGQNLTPQGTIENLNPFTVNCVLGTSEIDLKASLLVVNPVVDNQLVILSPLVSGSITMMNVLGEVVYKESDCSGVKINIQLDSGTYFLHISQNEQSYQQKIIVL